MQTLRVILTISFLHILFASASCQATDTNTISNEKFQDLMVQKNVVILDVRTSEEFSAGHIPNAWNTDVLQTDSFQKMLSTLPKDKTYLLYCRSGKRSLKALQLMHEAGFTSVKHLESGFSNWNGPVNK